MTTYLYPQNLKATANLWLWSLRDFAIMSIALLLSILILAQTRIIVPLAVTLCFGFLSIRLKIQPFWTLSAMLLSILYQLNRFIFGQKGANK